MSRLADRVLRGASLVVTDRRWAGALSAMALGFGVFVGVAIGPSASGTLAGVSQVIEIPDTNSGTSGEPGGGGSSSLAGGGGGLTGGGGSGAGLTAPAPPAPTGEPLAPEDSAPPPPEDEEAPAGEEGVQLEGTVVHLNPAAGSYTLAIRGGELVSVHAEKLPAPETKLSLVGRPLENNTFAETDAPARQGKASRVTLRGVVTSAGPDPGGGVYTVSGRGSSIPIHVRPDPAGTPPALPPVGSYATLSVDIENVPVAEAGPAADSALAEPTATAAVSPPLDPIAASAAPPCEPEAAPRYEPRALLWQSSIEVEGESSTYIDLAGVLSAVCPAAGGVLLSADDTRAGLSDLTLAASKRIDIGKLRVGDSYVATATIDADGALTLAGIASDEGVRGADDTETAQGDLKR